MAPMIQNPVLTGFHPDPSICRVGDDYYIATSTFEWWPAVRIHHSRDLVHWQHAAYAVTRQSQLNLVGHDDSAGVWAPCLSHHDGQFWLIYSDVRSMFGAYKDVRNYLITAPSIEGPWSEPIFMNSSGFDPSLFHDDDGRQWFVNQRWIHQPGRHPFHDIVLQEYDHRQQRLVGPVSSIFKGTELGVTEAPHLYRRNGFYYLLTAEGGTSFEHAATVARSRSITGPYELMPGNPLMTALGSPKGNLQRTGHASWVETAQGEWVMAFLCGRPVQWQQLSAEDAATPPAQNDANSMLGRETALERLVWDADGWPRLQAGGVLARHQVPVPDGHAPHPFPAEPVRDDFDALTLSPHWNSLRAPVDESWASLSARPGWLRLKGRESLASRYAQSLLGRRQQHLRCSASTKLDFEPTHFQQMAGLAAYYSTKYHAYLHLSAHEGTGERVLRLSVTRAGVPEEPVAPLPVSGPIELGLDLDHQHLQFRFRLDGQPDWQVFGPVIDASFLSDEASCKFFDGFAYSFGFTGNYIALACQDLAGTGLAADFAHFEYEGL
jgi:xylan 1,4-beta-xylosidase